MTIAGVEFNPRLTILIILSTILPMLDYYGHSPTGTKAFDRFILYFLIPMVIILLVYRERPADYGFRRGHWEAGLRWTMAICLVMALVLWQLARTPEMQSYYLAKAPRNPVRFFFLTAVDLLGWEFIWRGFVLFGMARVLGPGPAIFLQAVPFAFMHLGKPEIETLSTIFGGAAFGLLAWRTKSFLYPFLVHYFITIFTMMVATGRIG
ncbi:MAG: CPBP family intramembrane glutamic endopeptidase [Chloroflexota bacterium]